MERTARDKPPRRGTERNPACRFSALWSERDPDWNDPDDPAPETEFYADTSRSIISSNDSPDIPFDKSLNPYRGCEHGCIYCYARPTHEYFGLSAGLDFERRIFVKPDAPELLRRALADPRWEPTVLAFSGVTDPYQPIERRLGITRRCLEVLAAFRNPVGLITKSALVARDRDVLAELARHRAASVSLSITSLDGRLSRALEPRAPQPERRLAAIRALSDAGVPTTVSVSPVIPGLNDHEIPRIVAAAAEAGAAGAGYVLLRLPHGVADLFVDWLDTHYPNGKNKVLNRIRAMHGGQLNDSRFGHRMRGEGLFAEQIEALFRTACRRADFGPEPELSTAAFRSPHARQLLLFEEPPSRSVSCG